MASCLSNGKSRTRNSSGDSKKSKVTVRCDQQDQQHANEPVPVSHHNAENFLDDIQQLSNVNEFDTANNRKTCDTQNFSDWTTFEADNSSPSMMHCQPYSNEMGWNSQTMPMDHPSSFTRLLNKNILILGTIGAGKSTIANNISDYIVFPSQTCSMMSNSRAPSIRGDKYISYKLNIEYGFLLIDTFGAFNPREFDTSQQKLQENFSKYLPGGPHLVIMVIRRGSSSPDELKVLNYIIQKRFTQAVNKSFTLIITAYEGVGKSKVAEKLKTFQETNESTTSLCQYALQGQGFHPVSFPDLDDIDDHHQKKTYKSKIAASKQLLIELVERSKTQLLFTEMFREVGKKNWSLLPPKEVAPACIPS